MTVRGRYTFCWHESPWRGIGFLLTWDIGGRRCWIATATKFGGRVTVLVLRELGPEIARNPLLDTMGGDTKRYTEQTKYRSSRVSGWREVFFKQ